MKKSNIEYASFSGPANKNWSWPAEYSEGWTLVEQRPIGNVVTITVSREKKQKKSAPRRKLDRYYTPSWLAEKLLEHVQLEGVVLEPCTGKNAIADVLRAKGLKVWTNDIDPNVEADFHHDAKILHLLQRDDMSIDYVITNPPFSEALPILKNALKYSTKGVAFLLRLSFLEPTYDRGVFWKENPPTQIVVLPRVSFTEDGCTDMVTCAWFIWEKDKMGTFKIDWVTK